MNLRKSIPLGVLITLAVPGAMALAQEQGQQMPMIDQGMHGTMGQQMDQGGCPMMGGMTGQGKQGMMGQGTMGPGMMQGGMGQGMMQRLHLIRILRPSTRSLLPRRYTSSSTKRLLQLS